MAERRVVVGVTAYAEDVVRDGPDRSSCRLVGSRYVDALERAGGVVVLLPARPDCDEPLARRLVGMLDALVLVGGGDVSGRWFGEADHPAIGPVDDARDVFEIGLAAAALDAGLPTLGVCRGMQVMAVAGGGSVEQHPGHPVAPRGGRRRPPVRGARGRGATLTWSHMADLRFRLAGDPATLIP